MPAERQPNIPSAPRAPQLLAPGGVLVALILLGLGCAAPPTLQRLGAAPEQELSTLLAAGSPARSWPVELSSESPWSLHNLEPVPRPQDGQVTLRATSEDPQLRLEVALIAEEVTTLLARLTSSERGEVKLFWAGPDEDFSEERQLSAHQSKRREALVFDVGSHPSWRGAIARLRLDPAGGHGSRVALAGIEALDNVSLESGIGRLDDRAYWIDLGLDRRAGWLIGQEARSWVVAASSGEQVHLGFAFGAFRLRGPIECDVELHLEVLTHPDGRWLSGWSGFLGSPDQGWRVFELPLPELPRGSLEIRARGASCSASTHLPALASLELYSVPTHLARSTSQRSSATR